MHKIPKTARLHMCIKWCQICGFASLELDVMRLYAMELTV